MKYYTHLILAVAALFLLAACSDDDTSTATTAPTGQNLTGSWAKACTTEGSGSFGVSFTLSSNVLTLSIPVYLSTPDCSGTADYSDTETISLTFLDAVTLLSTETVSRGTLTITADTITPATAAGVSALNGTYGGITSWAVGTAQDVLGLNDDGTTASLVELNIFYLNETASPNTLTLGNTDGTLDSEGYPSTLGTSSFTKQ